MSQLALIALGSNAFSTWGDATEAIQKAMLHLEEIADSTLRKSRLFSTPAFPAGAGPDFVNAAVAFSTDLDAAKLMTRLHEIEAAAQRVRTQRWGPRTLDLDLIGLGDLVCPDAETHENWRNLSLAEQQEKTPDQLIVPHPRLQDRPFVLVPLQDIAPMWLHPLLGLTVDQMCGALCPEDIATVVPLD